MVTLSPRTNCGRAIFLLDLPIMVLLDLPQPITTVVGWGKIRFLGWGKITQQEYEGKRDEIMEEVGL
jgi:hypothetical protein